MRLWTFFTAGALAAAMVWPTIVGAADITDVIDADDGDDPYDFTAEILYSRALRRAKITREYNCPQTNRDRETACPGVGPEGTIVHTKELRYERVTHALTPVLRFGIWHDLELRVEAPIVLTDVQMLRFAGNGGERSSPVITPETSSIAPADEENLFDVPVEGLPTRAGFGDMQFMLRWSPISQERDESRGNWTLEIGYRAPTGNVMKWDNTGVGGGTHELTFATSLSRRYRYLDPYSRFFVTIPYSAGGSLFKDYGDAQKHVGPGAYGGFDLGMEVVPYHDRRKSRKFYLDVGMGAVLRGKGRDYSELFDALGRGAQSCNRDGPGGARNCGRYNPDSRSELRDAPHDGITTVDPFVTFEVHGGLGFHAGEYVRMSVDLGLAHDTEHFSSSADIGEDLDGSGLVEADGDANYNPVEHNPTFVSAIDSVGRRLRIEETTVFTVGFKAALDF